MNKENTWYERMLEVLKNPPLPQKPKEEVYSDTVAFPDSDTSEKEVKEYINGKPNNKK